MKQVDKRFREELLNYESEVHREMWDRISPNLEKETKFRPLIWMMAFIGTVALVAILWYLVGNSSQQESGLPSKNEVSEVLKDQSTEDQENFVMKSKEIFENETNKNNDNVLHENNDLNANTLNNVRNIPSELKDIKSSEKDVKLIVTKSVYDGVTNENITTTTVKETKRSNRD